MPENTEPWFKMEPCGMLIPRDTPPLRTVKGTLIKSRAVRCKRPKGHEGPCEGRYENGLIMAAGQGEPDA